MNWLGWEGVVLGYIAFKNDERAIRRVAPWSKGEFFITDNYRLLFSAVYEYISKVGTIRDLSHFIVFLESKNFGISAEASLAVLKELRELVAAVDYPEFDMAFSALFGIMKVRFLKKAIQEVESKVEEKGYEWARDCFLRLFQRLEDASEVPTESASLLMELRQTLIESKNDVNKVETGFKRLDEETLGFRPGEVILLAGWTAVGKTTFMINIAVDVMVRQKKNVIYITTETVKSQLRRRIFSCLSKRVCRVPIPSRMFKSGEFNKEMADSIMELKTFLETEKVGNLVMIQAPAVATLDWVKGKLIQYESRFKIDLLIIDDIRNLTPASRKKQEFEEMGSLLRDTKKLARTHAGRGIPIISPYHINREAYKTSKEIGSFDLRGLSSTAESERIADVVLGIWREDERSNEMELRILKMRDGRAGRRIKFLLDLDYQYMEELRTEEEFDQL